MSDQPSGSIPQSNALAEAESGQESLTELLSRDPEKYQTQDLDRIISALREQREKWSVAEATKQPRAKKAGPLTKATGLSLEDMGF